MGADTSTLAGAANPQKNGGRLNWYYKNTHLIFL
jgi:hypothetical protein